MILQQFAIVESKKWYVNRLYIYRSCLIKQQTWNQKRHSNPWPSKDQGPRGFDHKATCYFCTLLCQSSNGFWWQYWDCRSRSWFVGRLYALVTNHKPRAENGFWAQTRPTRPDQFFFLVKWAGKSKAYSHWNSNSYIST